MRAVQHIQDGANPEELAESLGLVRSTVFGWVAKFRAGGMEALRAKPIPGRPSKLSDAQMRTLFTLISGANPLQFELEFALWTRQLVRQVIVQKFDVELSVVSVGRLLRKLGMSPQRPLVRATQQDAERVRRWKEEDYPAIRADAAQLGARVYFQDEAGIRSDYHAATTWAPVGQTPVVRSTGARHSINMISAITAQGAMFFSTFTGGLNAERFIGLCRDLLHDDGGTVFLVVDGHPAHRANIVAEFVESTGGRLRLFFLPPYSPELNPDEWVWKSVKHDHMGKTAITSAEDLAHKAEMALCRLKQMPDKICAFFKDPDLRYITA
jgi:transposase